MLTGLGEGSRPALTGTFLHGVVVLGPNHAGVRGARGVTREHHRAAHVDLLVSHVAQNPRRLQSCSPGCRRKFMSNIHFLDNNQIFHSLMTDGSGVTHRLLTLILKHINVKKLRLCELQKQERARTSEGQAPQHADLLPGFDVLHLADVHALVAPRGAGQGQLQAELGALQAGQSGLGEGMLGQAQRVARLDGRGALRVEGAGQAEPGQVPVEEHVRLAPQNHRLLLDGLAGRRHAELQAVWGGVRRGVNRALRDPTKTKGGFSWNHFF